MILRIGQEDRKKLLQRCAENNKAAGLSDAGGPAQELGATLCRAPRLGAERLDDRSGKLYRKHSRLYRNKIVQENMRWKALAETYTMHSFAPISNLNFFVKNRQFFCD